MEEYISTVVDSFSEFLSGIEHKLRDSNSGNILVSFAHPLEDYSFSDKIDRTVKLFERSFLLEKPDDNFLLLGLDEALAISENGDGRFAVTDKRVKELKNGFLNNWKNIDLSQIPLFMGGMKFMSEHSDSDWQDFNDSTWFVPEITILCSGGKNFLFFNFLKSGGFSKSAVTQKLSKKLEILLNQRTQQTSRERSHVKSITGTSPKDKKKWKNLVSQALELIEENRIEKIVLSRKVELLLSAEPDLDYIISDLRKSYSGCYIFIFHHGKSNFFGATPEKLARFDGGRVLIDALAGSAARGADPEEDSRLEEFLLNDSKNINEHNFVIEYIKSSISELTEDFSIESGLTVKKLANIQHLWSKISAVLKSPNTMLNVIKELYPTPAVCGLPKDVSLQLIKKLEGYKRGLYSGIVGWFNFNDEGEFAVAIRSALTTNNKLAAFAGCGIVNDSDPEAEFKETELKLKTILSLFTDENKS